MNVEGGMRQDDPCVCCKVVERDETRGMGCRMKGDRQSYQVAIPSISEWSSPNTLDGNMSCRVGWLYGGGDSLVLHVLGQLVRVEHARYGELNPSLLILRLAERRLSLLQEQITVIGAGVLLEITKQKC